MDMSKDEEETSKEATSIETYRYISNHTPQVA